MVAIPNMVMIGATARNTGKTTLAVRLIDHLRRTHRIVGVKITPVSDVRQPCPRGGAGCGVCDALTAPFEICEQRGQSLVEGKDTTRLHAAGAEAVFWVKALRSRLVEAVTALRERVPPEAVVVCEATGLRAVVEPGLFLLTEDEGAGDLRPSARAVGHLADRLVRLRGGKPDLDVTRLRFDGRRWHWPAPATAVILAGGRSRRMGRDKSRLPVGGQALIASLVDRLRPAFDRVLISSNTPAAHADLGVRLVTDPESGQGPLMGILTALRHLAQDTALVVACDMPRVDVSLARDLVRQARDVEAVIPRSGPDRAEPLFAAYRRSLIGPMEQALAAGRRRVLDALDGRRVRWVDLDAAQRRTVTNLNTAEDYARFLRETRTDS